MNHEHAEQVALLNAEIARLQQRVDELLWHLDHPFPRCCISPWTPTLKGSVTHVGGRLVAVAISDNPDDVDLSREIRRMPFRFAIFGEHGNYKGEVVAQKYDSEANCVLGRVLIQADNVTIAPGDLAASNP